MKFKKKKKSEHFNLFLSSTNDMKLHEVINKYLMLLTK